MPSLSETGFSAAGPEQADFANDGQSIEYFTNDDKQSIEYFANSSQSIEYFANDVQSIESRAIFNVATLVIARMPF